MVPGKAAALAADIVIVASNIQRVQLAGTIWQE